MEQPVSDKKALVQPLLPLANLIKLDNNKEVNSAMMPLLKQHMGIRTQIKSAPIPGKFTLSSLLLTLATSQSLFALIAVLAITILEPILEPLIWPLFWLPIAAAVVYVLCFLIVWRFKQKLRVSSSCILFVATIMVCEAIMLTYIAMIWEPLLVLTELIIYVVSMYTCAAYSQCALSKYSYIGGRIVALITTVILFVFFVIFLDK